MFRKSRVHHVSQCLVRVCLVYLRFRAHMMCSLHVVILILSILHGNVVCSDGNILSMDKFKQSDKEAVGIVFHVNRSPDADNLGYAVTFMIWNHWLLPTVLVLTRVLLHH